MGALAPEASTPSRETHLWPPPSITEEGAVGATATSSPLPAAASSSAQPAGCLGNGRRRGDAPRDGGVCHRGSCRAPASCPRPLKVPITLPTPPILPLDAPPLQHACFPEGNAPFLPAGDSYPFLTSYLAPGPCPQLPSRQQLAPALPLLTSGTLAREDKPPGWVWCRVVRAGEDPRGREDQRC